MKVFTNFPRKAVVNACSRVRPCMEEVVPPPTVISFVKSYLEYPINIP